MSLSIQEAVQQLQIGSVVALPTETVYGLAADALNPEAVEKIYQLKGRDFHKPCSVAIAKPSDAMEWIMPVAAEVVAMMAQYWPGALTLLLPVKPERRDVVRGCAGKIGLRCPDAPMVQAVLQQLQRPLILTSANPSGQADAKTAADVKRYFADSIGIVEADSDVGGLPSTILDVCEKPYRIVRQGELLVP